MKTEEEVKKLLDKAELDHIKTSLEMFQLREEGNRGKCWEYIILHQQRTINLLRTILGMELLTESEEWGNLVDKHYAKDENK